MIFIVCIFKIVMVTRACISKTLQYDIFLLYSTLQITNVWMSSKRYSS
jgi:hypothetical protein